MKLTIAQKASPYPADRAKLELEAPVPTIQTKIEIAEDRRLRLDLTLPEGFPAGQAKVVIYIAPDVENEPLVPLSELVGSLKDSPIFSGDPMEVQRKIRSDAW